MKKHILCFVFCALNAVIFAQNIIPIPVDFQATKGALFRLSNATTIGGNTPEAKIMATFLADKISIPTGFKFKIINNGNVQFNINAVKNPTIGDEGYTLEVTTKSVKINANKPAGLFYGAQTILQMLPKEIETPSVISANWTIPTAKITDYPRFGWRGLMLDCSRHFFQKEEVKRYIDHLSRYKFNTFHWHLTDDQGWRIEIKSLPKLTQIGGCRVQRYGKWGQLEAAKDGEAATDCGFYTQEDVKEIVAFAQARNVTIVPEVDVPGHSMAAIASYPELCCTKDAKITVSPGHKFSEWYGGGKFKMLVDNSLDPSNEGVYTFLDKVFTEIASLFPNPYIHIGGDECYHGYWEKDENCLALIKKEGLKSTYELQSFFIKRLEKIVNSKGKKLIGWDEILEGGLAPGASVMSWQGFEGGIAAAKQGHDVVMTPNDFVYIDLPQGDTINEPDATSYKTVRLKKMYSFEPVPDSIDAKYILGGQANLWTEKAPTMRHAEYLTFPRAWAAADIYWSPKTSRNWDAFVGRVENQFERADVMQMNYARSAFDAIIKTKMVDNKLMVDIATEVNGLDIFYTINETTPDIYTPQYKQPFELPEGPVTLKVNTFRNGKMVGKMIKISRSELLKRVVK